MQLGFLSSAKRKLSSKAQAALDEGGNPSWKRKNNDGTTMTMKNIQSAGGHTEDNSDNNFPAAASPIVNPSVEVQSARTASRQATVHTEDEEMALHEDAEVITIKSNEGTSDEASPEEELEQLMKEWNSPVYAFFESKPKIVEIEGRFAHDFKCAARGCKVKVRRYTDTKDARSTSNLRKHVKVCKGWGDAILKAADDAQNAQEVKTKIIRRFLSDGTITAVFERKGKGTITYSHRQYTRDETRYVCVTSYRACTESLLELKLYDGSRKTYGPSTL